MARILIVDDSSFQRRMIRTVVEAEGYEVLEADGGRHGVEMATTHRPDCMLIDLVMPEVDGLAVLERLRDQRLKIPVIVLTADIGEKQSQQCLELGAVAVISKPLKTDEFRHALNKVFDHKQEAA